MTTCTETRTDLRKLSLKETAEVLMTAALLLKDAGEDPVVDRDLRMLQETAESLVARLGLHAAHVFEDHPQLFEGIA